MTREKGSGFGASMRLTETSSASRQTMATQKGIKRPIATLDTREMSWASMLGEASSLLMLWMLFFWLKVAPVFGAIGEPRDRPSTILGL